MSLPAPKPPPNAISRTFGLLGDEWTLLILRACLTGTSKYSDFATALPISPSTLSHRHETLIEAGILQRSTYQSHPPRAEYLLTSAGKATWPILTAIWNWERTWISDHRHATPPIVHRTCGAQTHTLYCCEHCKEPIPAHNATWKWGPTGTWQSSVPTKTTRRRSPANLDLTPQHNQGLFYPATMMLLGNRWSTAILGAAFLGTHRFRDFQNRLQIPPGILAKRLQELCQYNILRREPLTENENWHHYLLTKQGLDLYPVISSIITWGQKWQADVKGAAIIRTHKACGKQFTGILHCGACQKRLRAEEIIAPTYLAAPARFEKTSPLSVRNH